jgi:hypothetical protein
VSKPQYLPRHPWSQGTRAAPKDAHQARCRGNSGWMRGSEGRGVETVGQGVTALYGPRHLPDAHLDKRSPLACPPALCTSRPRAGSRGTAVATTAGTPASVAAEDTPRHHPCVTRKPTPLRRHRPTPRRHGSTTMVMMGSRAHEHTAQQAAERRQHGSSPRDCEGHSTAPLPSAAASWQPARRTMSIAFFRIMRITRRSCFGSATGAPAGTSAILDLRAGPAQIG